MIVARHPVLSFVATLLSAVLCASPAQSQASSAKPASKPPPRPLTRGQRLVQEDNDFQIWTPVYLYTRRGRFRGMFEVNPRIGANATHMDQLLIRPAIGYQITPAVSLWQGYGWTPVFLPQYNSENRIWQQVLVENLFPRFALINRTRLEERFIEHVGPTGYRIRHFIRGVKPLNKRGNWSAVVYDELFINLNSINRAVTSGINQNRLFVGINHKLTEKINFDLGYQYQYINRNFPLDDRNNHILLMNWNFNI